MRRHLLSILILPLLSACDHHVPMTRHGMAVAPLPEAESADAQLMRDYCGQCHAVPAPTAHIAATWPAVVTRMVTLMKRDGRRVPSDAERERLVAYLQRHGR